MSGEGEGWAPHPDAVNSDQAFLRVAVKPCRVIGLGAICGLRPKSRDGSQSFSVSEFVALEDGQQVILHEDRGFTCGPLGRGRAPAIRGRRTRGWRASAGTF